MKRLRTPTPLYPITTAAPTLIPRAAQHRRQPDTAARSLVKRTDPAPPPPATQSAGRPAGPPKVAVGWSKRAVSHIEGRAAAAQRSRPPALIDIIGARRGRPGCSRGSRAGSPVREPELSSSTVAEAGEGAGGGERERQLGGRERRAGDSQCKFATVLSHPPSGGGV